MMLPKIETKWDKLESQRFSIHDSTTAQIHERRKIEKLCLLYGKKRQIRGKHAHKKCSQLFLPISGKFILSIKTPDSEKKIILNHKNKTAILVPPKYWCGVKFLTKDSVIMVVCDKEYDFNDYLEDFDEYKAYLKKIWKF